MAGKKKLKKCRFNGFYIGRKIPKSQKYQIFEQDGPVLWNGNVRTKLDQALLLCEYGAH